LHKCTESLDGAWYRPSTLQSHNSVYEHYEQWLSILVLETHLCTFSMSLLSDTFSKQAGDLNPLIKS